MLKSLFASGLMALASAGAAHATVVWNYVETGGNVVGTFSGSLDLTGMVYAGTTGLGIDGGIRPSRPFVLSHDAGTRVDVYVGGSTTSFGTGLLDIADSSTGDSLGMGFGNILAISPGYVSGSALSGSHTFLGETFASLGISTGSYVFTLPSDTITLNFGTVSSITPVPLPASLPLMLGALGLGGLLARRRRRS